MSDNETGVIPPNESGGVSVTGTESSGTTTPSEPDKVTDISDDRTQEPIETIRSNEVEVVSSSSINDPTADEGSTPSDADLYLNGTSHASFDPGVGTLHGSGQVDYGVRPANASDSTPTAMRSYPTSAVDLGEGADTLAYDKNLGLNGKSSSKQVRRADLRLMDDTTSADRLIDPGNREPVKPAFLMSLKTFGWWLLVPMIAIGGLAGSLFGMIIYWVTAQDFGISYTMTTGQTPGDAQTLLPVDGQSSSMHIASGLLSNATVWSLVFTGVSAIVFFLMKWRKRAPDASGSLSWRTRGKLDVWWKMLMGALVGLAFYGAYLIVGWGISVVGLNFTSSDTGSTVENMILDLWHTGGALNWFNLVMLLSCVCVINPIAEELVFRGMIGRRLVDSKMLRTGVDSNGPRKWWGSLLVCLLGGLFFGVVHFTSLSMAGFLPVILTTLLGALCVWLSSIKTRSLWVSIAAHVAFNSVQMLILVLTLV